MEDFLDFDCCISECVLYRCCSSIGEFSTRASAIARPRLRSLLSRFSSGARLCSSLGISRWLDRGSSRPQPWRCFYSTRKRTLPNAARARHPRGDDQGAVCAAVPRGLFARVSTRFTNLEMPTAFLSTRGWRRSVQALAEQRPGYGVRPSLICQRKRSIARSDSAE